LDFEYSHYRTAFEKVEEAFSRIIEEARPAQEKDSRPNHSWQISSKLQKIGFFINWELLHLYDDALKEDRISENDKQANIRKVDYGWYPTSMTAAYAELVFKLLCDLSSYPVKEAQRDFALQIAGDLIVFDHHPSVEKIREILLEFIWKQINVVIQSVRAFFVFAKHHLSEFAVSRYLILKFMADAKLVHIESVHDLNELLEDFFLFDVSGLAGFIQSSRASIVNISMDVSIFLFFKFFGSAHT